MMRPTRPEIGQRASASAVTMAPAAGAARKMPKPSGPVRKMSRAKIGNSAVALPSSTANRSSSTAPSTTLWPVDEGEAAEQRLEIDRRARRPSPLHRDAEHDNSGGKPQHCADRKHQCRAESRPECRRAPVRRRLRFARPRSSRRWRAATRSAGTMFGSTDCRLGCSKARPVPTTKAMASRRPGVSHAGGVRGRQDGDRKRLDELRDEGDAAAVVAVRDMAGE